MRSAERCSQPFQATLSGLPYATREAWETHDTPGFTVPLHVPVQKVSVITGVTIVPQCNHNDGDVMLRVARGMLTMMHCKYDA